MPAVQLARLRLQAAHLRESFSRPQAFVRGLHAMLDTYADRTHRHGQAGEPPPLISAYHAPAPVLRQILVELLPLIAQDPEGALELSELLWEQDNLECRILAASIIGRLPASFDEQSWARVQSWALLEKENQLLGLLLDQGLAGFRQRSIRTFLGQVEVWLNSENLHEQRLGLIALRPLVKEAAFENLPTLFRLLTRLARAAPMTLRLDLLAVLREMIQLSPNETAYFLRQTLDSPNSLDTPWIIRQLLPDFSLEIRTGLRDVLRQVGK